MRQTHPNIVYGMHSGLALLLDVHQPDHSNGHGVIYINGSGWHAPLGHDATPLKETPMGSLNELDQAVQWLTERGAALV